MWRLFRFEGLPGQRGGERGRVGGGFGTCFVDLIFLVTVWPDERFGSAV